MPVDIIHTSTFLSQRKISYRFYQNQIIIILTKLNEKNINIYDVKEIYFKTILHDKLSDILSSFQIISCYDSSISIYMNFAIVPQYALYVKHNNLSFEPRVHVSRDYYSSG